MRNPDLGLMSCFFVFTILFCRNWVNGVDLDRFCVPEHICELWFLFVFLGFDFFGESVC